MAHRTKENDFPSEKDPKFAEKKEQATKSEKVKSTKTKSMDSKSETESTEAKVEKLTEANLKDLIDQDPDQEITDLEKQVAELQQKNADLEDQYLRSQAEIQNMHTRHQRERENLQKYSAQQLGTAILPVADNLERALSVKAEDEQSQQLHKGVEMVLEHLQQALTANNIEALGEVGEKFDPTKHQAVQTAAADKDHPADTIVQVLQKGYQLKDRVIRPAMVVVAN